MQSTSTAKGRLDLKTIPDKDVLNVLKRMNLQSFVQARQMNSGIYEFVREHRNKLAARSDTSDVFLLIEVVAREQGGEETQCDLIFTVFNEIKSETERPVGPKLVGKPIYDPDVQLSGAFFQAVILTDYEPKPEREKDRIDLNSLTNLNIKTNSVDINLWEPQTRNPSQLLSKIQCKTVSLAAHYTEEEVVSWPIKTCTTVLKFTCASTVPTTLVPFVQIVPKVELQFAEETFEAITLIVNFLKVCEEDRRARGIFQEMNIAYEDKDQDNTIAGILTLNALYEIWKDTIDGAECSIYSLKIDGGIFYVMITDDIVIRFAHPENNENIIQQFIKNCHIWFSD